MQNRTETSTTSAVERGTSTNGGQEPVSGIAGAEAAIRAMTYPTVGADGAVFDRAVERTDPDRYVDECPSWCVQAPHCPESQDDDRSHYGVVVGIPVRSIVSSYEDHHAEQGPLYVLGCVEVYLQRRVLHRDATIRLGELDGAGIEYTLDEAETVARTLLGMVEAGR